MKHTANRWACWGRQGNSHTQHSHTQHTHMQTHTHLCKRSTAASDENAKWISAWPSAPLHWFIVRINYAAICQTLSAFSSLIFRAFTRLILPPATWRDCQEPLCSVCRLQFTSPKRAAAQVASNCRWQSAKLPDINISWESPLKFNSRIPHSHTHTLTDPSETCNRVEFNAICCSHQSNCCQSMADAAQMSACNFAQSSRKRREEEEEEKVCFLAELLRFFRFYCLTSVVKLWLIQQWLFHSNSIELLFWCRVFFFTWLGSFSYLCIFLEIS